MRSRKVWIPAMLAAAMSATAALAFAQTPDNAGGGRHRHQRNSQQWQACKQQADDKKLDRGDARKSFMRDCLKAAGKDTGKDAGQQNPGA
jgi:hypothetical protein